MAGQGRQAPEVDAEDAAHPALIGLACEAVGGNADLTTQVGVAYVLLAGGADIHDDIIDDSAFKYSRETVLGKFGKDIAILAGDALLFKGFFTLEAACTALPREHKNAVLDLTKSAFFGISSAEAEESILREKSCSPPPEEYLDMIKTKAAVGEATMKIGAILGGGTAEKVEALGKYGRAIGILLTVRDEFIDTFDLDELRNRVAKECLPLPVLFTLNDSKKEDKLNCLLKEGAVTEKKQKKILDLVTNSKGTRELKKQMRSIIKEETQRLILFGINSDCLKLMLRSTVEDL